MSRFRPTAPWKLTFSAMICGSYLDKAHPLRSAASVADDRPKLRLVAKRSEIVVACRSLAEPVRQIRGAANVLERVGRSARQGFAARKVVEQERRVREPVQLLVPACDRLVVLALRVQRLQGRPR